MLFNRSGRGVTPTQDGAEFLLYARRLTVNTKAMDKYGSRKNIKHQVREACHTFAVKAFVETGEAL